MLAAELKDRIDRITRQWTRHLLTDDECASDLYALIETWVATNDSVGRSGPQPREDVQTQTSALVVAAAKAAPVPPQFLAIACSASPPTNDPDLDRIIEATLDTYAPDDRSDGDGGIQQLAITWLGHGGSEPHHLDRLMGTATALTPGSWIAYLAARNRDDKPGQQRILTADIDAGCSASLLTHLRAESAAAVQHHWLAEVDRDKWSQEHRWGDLAAIAIYLAEQGQLDLAHEWSGAVDDRHLSSTSTSDTRKHHHAVLGPPCALDDGDRVFAPLALIDYLACDAARAQTRAAAFINTANLRGGALSWTLAAHNAMSTWIRSRFIANERARQSVLESIHYRHTWLGLLQAQIDADLAELLTRRNLSAATRHRDQARAALKRPHVALHLATFHHDQLLRQLPYPKQSEQEFATEYSLGCS